MKVRDLSPDMLHKRAKITALPTVLDSFLAANTVGKEGVLKFNTSAGRVTGVFLALDIGGVFMLELEDEIEIIEEKKKPWWEFWRKN